MKTVKMLTLVIAAFALITTFVACNDDEENPAVLASFTYQVDGTNFKMVTFTNTSQNFTSVSWDFGDNSALSFEVNPVHTYAELGDYTVTLTANASDGSKDVYTTTITIADPNAELTKLVGETSKTWKLIRVTDSGRYPIEVGPEDHSMIWWAMGLNNDELANRPCMLNDEWTFNRDLTMVFDAKGDYWAEGGIFDPENMCNTTDQMVGNEGEDLSAWGGGTFDFDMTTGTEPTITVNGLGAFIGFFKLGNGTEVDVPQETITYDIVKLTDDEVDTLIVEGIYRWDPNASGGYWRFTLVHYDDPNQEPPIPAPAPIASFTTTISGLTITCNNTTQYGQTYNWDFGDGTTSTEQNPVHTYAGDGIYLCKLTATNPNGNSSAELFQMVSATTLTDEVLQGTWKVRPEALSIFVGPGMGSHTWWSVPVEFFTSGTGGDDWSCIIDDEFTFAPGGIYTYDGKGSVRNDGYFGSPNGCWDESTLTGNGLYFATGNHTYAFTPASGSNRATILLTNGPDRAAFLGFYKGYYGGENTESTVAPNGGNPTNKYEVMGYCAMGGKEYLFVTIDIRASLIGEASWSVILER